MIWLLAAAVVLVGCAGLDEPTPYMSIWSDDPGYEEDASGEPEDDVLAGDDTFPGEDTAFPEDTLPGEDVEPGEDTDPDGFVFVPAHMLYIEVKWDHQGCPSCHQITPHFLRPSGDWYGIPDDCHWRNNHPNWGSSGAVDDPTFYGEYLFDSSGKIAPLYWDVPAPSPETVPGVYKIAVQGSMGQTIWGENPPDVTLRIWVEGELVFKKTTMLNKGDLWEAATFEWPAGIVTETVGEDGGLVINPNYCETHDCGF